VSKWLLTDKRLKPFLLRVLIALLCYADPRRPAKPVWPTTQTLAVDVALRPSRRNMGRVRDAIHVLDAAGYLVVTTPKRRRLRVCLGPVLTASGLADLVTLHEFFTERATAKRGAPTSVTRGPQTGSTRAPRLGASTEQTTGTDQDQTTPAAADLCVSTSNGNGRHPQADWESMQQAARNAAAIGISREAFWEAVNARPDLTAQEVKRSVDRLWERSHANASDAAWRGWLRRERGGAQTSAEE
jgi:hypothetical protein